MTVREYHDGTKHHYERFARSLGYLDWASQPDPFRSFDGAPQVALPPRPDAPGGPAAAALGNVLRHALGLSAWKRFRGASWSLRVNPSSGNLHPTEAYVICGPIAGIATAAGVYHYAADRHALERRCAFDVRAWHAATGQSPAAATGDSAAASWLVALTSIHWRESWKYGERAFRYCQHDLGHAIAAIRFSASLFGYRARLVPEVSQRMIAALTGVDRDADYVDAEREEPGCIIVVSRESLVVGRESSVVGLESPVAGCESLIEAVRAGQWTGRASQLSKDHVQWTFIDDIARATEDVGHVHPARAAASADSTLSAHPALPACPALPAYPAHVIVRRRSALAFDGHSSIAADRWLAMLDRVMPDNSAPWDAVWWDARIHLALFVHRVDDVPPGLYLLVRNTRALEALRTALTRDFVWERTCDGLPLFLLARGDCRRLAERLSCDQAIAADGFFSLAMLAEFDPSVAEFGASFYRHLFWESGIVGQTLYLEAEAAGARATGIGCFYDDPVHDVLGIVDHTFQSLYHFTIGVPVEDTRLTTEPGYPWESDVVEPPEPEPVRARRSAVGSQSDEP